MKIFLPKLKALIDDKAVLGVANKFFIEVFNLSAPILLVFESVTFL